VSGQRDAPATFVKVHLAKGQPIPPLDAVRAFYDEHDHALEAMLSGSSILERVEQPRVLPSG
jgi:hypothetical protein